jgi:hypothetical protein
MEITGGIRRKNKKDSRFNFNNEEYSVTFPVSERV